PSTWSWATVRRTIRCACPLFDRSPSVARISPNDRTLMMSTTTAKTPMIVPRTERLPLSLALCCEPPATLPSACAHTQVGELLRLLSFSRVDDPERAVLVRAATPPGHPIDRSGWRSRAR